MGSASSCQAAGLVWAASVCPGGFLGGRPGDAAGLADAIAGNSDDDNRNNS